MQYEARNFLEENIIEGAISESTFSVVQDYEDVSQDILLYLAIERTEGHLHGVYRFWSIMNDEELTKDHKEEITEMVTNRGEQFKEMLTRAEKENSSDTAQPSVFDT